MNQRTEFYREGEFLESLATRKSAVEDGVLESPSPLVNPHLLEIIRFLQFDFLRRILRVGSTETFGSVFRKANYYLQVIQKDALRNYYRPLISSFQLILKSYTGYSNDPELILTNLYQMSAGEAQQIFSSGVLERVDWSLLSSLRKKSFFQNKSQEARAVISLKLFRLT